MKGAILALKSPLGPVDTCPSILLNGGCLLQVPDPNLEVRGGGGHPDPEISGGGQSLKKIIFSALWASVWSENKGGGVGWPGPSPRSATD